MKVFVCKKKIYVRKKRISKIRRKKIHILLRKFEKKESISETFQGQKMKKVKVTQRSVCKIKIISRLELIISLAIMLFQRS